MSPTSRRLLRAAAIARRGAGASGSGPSLRRFAGRDARARDRRRGVEPASQGRDRKDAAPDLLGAGRGSRKARRSQHAGLRDPRARHGRPRLRQGGLLASPVPSRRGAPDRPRRRDGGGRARPRRRPEHRRFSDGEHPGQRARLPDGGRRSAGLANRGRPQPGPLRGPQGLAGHDGHPRAGGPDRPHPRSRPDECGALRSRGALPRRLGTQPPARGRARPSPFRSASGRVAGERDLLREGPGPGAPGSVRRRVPGQRPRRVLDRRQGRGSGSRRVEPDRQPRARARGAGFTDPADGRHVRDPRSTGRTELWRSRGRSSPSRSCRSRSRAASTACSRTPRVDLRLSTPGDVAIDDVTGLPGIAGTLPANVKLSGSAPARGDDRRAVHRSRHPRLRWTRRPSGSASDGQPFFAVPSVRATAGSRGKGPLTGRVTAPSGTLKSLPFADLAANWSWDKGALTLRPSARVYGGTLGAGVDADLAHPGSESRLELEVQGVQAQPLLESLTSVRNVFSGAMHGSCPWRARASRGTPSRRPGAARAASR